MLVVRRSFRNYGEMMLPGSVVEPGSIKWLKSRIKDRYIVEVTAHNFDYWSKYFIGKFGVQLQAIGDEGITDTATDVKGVVEDVEATEQPKERVVVKAVYKD